MREENTVQALLCALLSYELFGVSTQATVSETILEEAKRHSITPLIYPALKCARRTPDALESSEVSGAQRVAKALQTAEVSEGQGSGSAADMSEAAQVELRSSVRRAALYSARRVESVLNCQTDLLTLLADIPCAVLKGMSVACVYPHAELRVPGDIDLLVREADLDRVSSILSEHGYMYTHATDLHTCFMKILPDGTAIDVEVHVAVSIFPNTSKGQFAQSYMSDALDHIQLRELDGTEFPVLTGVYQLIALLSHMERHLMILGIGLRQMCDWAVTVHALRGEIGQSELDALEKCGLLQFARVCTRLCEKYLGLPELIWSRGVEEDEVDALFRDVMESGDFHAQSSVRPLISSMTDGYNVEEKSSFLHSYLTGIRRRVKEDYSWTVRKRKNKMIDRRGQSYNGNSAERIHPLWVVFFAVFYPVRYLFRMLRGKSPKVDVQQTVSAARSREKMLRGLKIYK